MTQSPALPTFTITHGSGGEIRHGRLPDTWVPDPKTQAELFAAMRDARPMTHSAAIDTADTIDPEAPERIRCGNMLYVHGYTVPGCKHRARLYFLY